MSGCRPGEPMPAAFANRRHIVYSDFPVINCLYGRVFEVSFIETRRFIGDAYFTAFSFAAVLPVMRPITKPRVIDAPLPG